MSTPRILIVGAGINGLVAANYLQRAGCQVTLLERAAKVGGACVSETAIINGTQQPYALGASVLGFMQQFIFEQTGLADRLQTFAPTHPKFVFFPGDEKPTWIYRDPVQLDKELERKWGETGDAVAFRSDESKVVHYLQEGYVNATQPTLEEAKQILGERLTDLWITGTARNLLDHYFTSDKSKVYMAMTVNESGPVSLDDPYSAFTIPLMDSGSVFGSYYGFVKGGIWRITEELDTINRSIGVTTHVSATVVDVDLVKGRLFFEQSDQPQSLDFDHLILATDPQTAARLLGFQDHIARTEKQQFRGSSGKLNLMFQEPVRWKYNSDANDSDTAFRFFFSVPDLNDFDRTTLQVLEKGIDYAPGYLQVYCEGAAMRHLQHVDTFDRLSVFFKNLAFDKPGDQLPEVETRVKEALFQHIENPRDCVWSRLLTPKDLKELFLFPEGNLDHTMLTGGQTFADRTYANDPATSFYRFAGSDNVYLCGAGTYPCGSVAGTPGYMCSMQLLRLLGHNEQPSRKKSGVRPARG